MNRKITGFHRDKQGVWSAKLECGHLPFTVTESSIILHRAIKRALDS
jgi:hypothetical protein